MLEKIKYYFTDRLWNFHLQSERGWRRLWIKWVRIGYLTSRGFFQDKCSLFASALTYYTLMSIVPVLAMAFAISRGFGYHERFRQELLQRFQDQNAAFLELFKYADTFLDQAKGGLIAGIGLIILFVTVALLLNNLEIIFNEIWGIKKTRSWRRVLSDYLALMLIGPIFFLAASSITVFVVDHLEIVIRDLPFSPWAVSWLLFSVNVIPYCLFWALFTFIYIFIPNAKVQFSSACLAGLLAGCLYVFVQWIYIYFQIGVSRYGAIYGSMAALPLFLIWVQLSWFILLLGAEISYAHQTLEEHEFEAKAGRVSHSFQLLLSLWIVHLSLKGFITKEMLCKRYQIPISLLKPVLQELIDCHILHESRGGYVPDHKTQSLKISDVIEIIETRGESDFPFIGAKQLAPFERALDEFRDLIETAPQNLRLSHVPHPF